MPTVRPFRLVLLLAALLAPALSPVPSDAQGAPVSEIVDAWLASPHAQREDEAFSHWNRDGEVPETCATCHSGAGLIDYLGADGSAAGAVDRPAPLGALVDCAACHNGAASRLEAVTFPSGVSVTGLGSSAICSVCHQGRQSGDAVARAVGDGDQDTVVAGLGFLNVHYRAAAATLMGAVARGGFQYEGRTYAERFAHVEALDTCTDCHSPHTTEVVPLAVCATCHKGAADLRAIRLVPVDYDGDGDVAEGVRDEIGTLHAGLLAAIQAYGREVVGTGIVYAPAAYPYFFVDGDGDGAVSAGEAAFPNRYQSWTPRLMKAAYNYQFVAKDPGAYAHNPRYALQLLHDSLASLGERVTVDMGAMVRP